MRKLLFLGASLLAFACPVHAQEVGDEDEWQPLIDPGTSNEEVITVTATGTRTEIEDTGQQVTILGEDEILEVQGPDITRVLQRVPGVSITRNGGLGGVTGIRLRGAEAEQLLVIVDGVRVADPAAPSGGFDFGNLTANNLDKIEVLRGANSLIWGSDAIGGVLVASTRAATGLFASGEYGSDDTVNAAVSGGLSDADLGFIGASASYVSTDGFSSAATGTEADGFEQWAVEGHARYYFSDTFEVFARVRNAEGELEIDGFPAPNFTLGDTNEVQETSQLFASTGFVYDTAPLFLHGTYSFADTERDNYDRDVGDTPTFTSDGRSDRVTLRGEWRPIGPLLVHFGAENEWTQYETLGDTGGETSIFGAYTQLGIERGPLSAHLGARVDDHEDFGTETSFAGDVSYAIAPDWRLRASIGEGFKAPTLFQLLSDFGNETLQPERSTSIDIGIARGDRSQSLYAAVTFFRRRTADQIAFVGCFMDPRDICVDRPFGTYDNVARAEAIGAEVEFGARPFEILQLGAAYAYIDAEDRGTGNQLARRPRHNATFTADLFPVEALTLGADLRVVSDSFDNAANTVRLDGYEVLDLRAALDLTTNVQLFGRVENVWDEDYQTAAGYASRGRSVFAGARLKL